VTKEAYSSSFKFPYGNVISCRELDREGHLFGSADLSVYLLLDTQRGLVAVRVDYRDLGTPRFYGAYATEIEAADVASGLSDDELAQLTKDASQRGGVRVGDWVLHYGDG
jgi:hypothetical protein